MHQFLKTQKNVKFRQSLVETSDFFDEFGKNNERKEIMKVIRVKELPKVVPPKHYDMFVRRAVDDSMGAKTMKVSFGHFEPNGVVEAHIHEKEEQVYIVLKGVMITKNEWGEEFRVNEGEALLIYPGEVHATSTGNEETDYICITGLNLPSGGSEIPEKKWK